MSPKKARMSKVMTSARWKLEMTSIGEPSEGTPSTCMQAWSKIIIKKAGLNIALYISDRKIYIYNNTRKYCFIPFIVHVLKSEVVQSVNVAKSLQSDSCSIISIL